MAKMELEGMDELIDKVNKLSVTGEAIKKNALDKVGKIVKDSMEKKAPRSDESKEHMADNIKVTDIKKSNGVDFVDIGPKKGDNSKFYYSRICCFV